MDNPDGTYTDDRLLTVFYQLLGVAPQLAAALYEPSLNEGVRSWLNDVWYGAPKAQRRWLGALFRYYGLSTGEAMSYVEVGAELGVTGQTARQLVARGLRYLWFVTKTATNDDPENMERLLQLALAANEWATTDPSDTVSLEWFLQRITEDGTVLQRVVTPKTPTTAAPSLGHRLKDPVNLWDPEHAAVAFPNLNEERRIPVV